MRVRYRKPSHDLAELKKTKPKQLDKLEAAHSDDKTRFSRFIAQLVDQVNDDETEYSKIMQRSKKAASESNVETLQLFMRLEPRSFDMKF